MSIRLISTLFFPAFQHGAVSANIFFWGALTYESLRMVASDQVTLRGEVHFRDSGAAQVTTERRGLCACECSSSASFGCLLFTVSAFPPESDV